MPKPLSVLNIEDTESDSDLIAHLLKKAGYKITFERVETETQMRAALKKRAWDVIISDHSLPQFDSYSALTLLHEEGLDIPFIAVSGTIGEEAVVEMMRAGAHDFLIKSNLARLIPAVERELEYAKVRRERRQAQEELLASEARFRQVWDTTSDAMALSDSEGIVLAVNPAYISLYGYPPDELIGQSFSIIFPQENRNWAVEQYKELFVSDMIPPVFEAVVRRADGTQRVVESNATFITKAGSRTAMLSTIRDITERKEVENELRASEKRFRALIENSLDDISLVAADGTLLWESPSVIRNLGYATNEFLNRNMFKLMHPDDLEWVQKLLGELVQKSASRQSGTFRLKHSNGTWRWVEAIATNMLDEPSVQAIVVNYRDVTERKKVEQELQSSEKLFRELVDNIDEVFWMTDPVSMQDIYISPAHKKVWGRILKDVDEFIETVQPEDRPIVSAALEMQKHGEKTDIRYRVTHLDGSVHWVWDRAFPVFDDLGNLKSVAGIATDITERRRAEQDIQQSEERFRSLFNSMLDGIYRSTHEGKFVDVNPAMVEMFGYLSREEMLAVDIKTELYFAPEERGSHVLDTGQEKMDVYCMRRKDGSEIWVEDHGTYIHDEQGNIIYHEGILRDITERKRANQVLAESEERFRQAIAAADAIPYNLQYYPRKYTYLGEGIKELAGYSFEEVTPELLDTLIVESVMLGGFKGMSVPESVKLVREGQSKVLWQCEHRIRTRSGEERWLVDSSIQVLGADGIPTGSIGMFQDITERKNAEMEIKERTDDVALINTLNEAVSRGESLNAIIKLFTKTLSQLIHSNEVTFYLPSSDGNSLVMQNMDRSLSTIKKVERLIGRPIPQIQIPIREGSFFHRVLHSGKGILSADPEAIQSWMGEFIETEYLPKAVRGGIRALVPQIYKLMDIHSLISIPLVSDNKIIASFDVTSSKIMTEIDLHRVQKISSQVAAVILRKIAEEKLYQTTQELKLLIEASPAAIITFTPENVVKSWNRAAEKIFGYKENEVVGRVAPHIASTELSEFHTLLEKLQQNEALENIELTRHRKDGTPIYISLNTALTYEADNHLNGYMAIITDITERKKSEEKLEQRARELQTLYETSMDVHSQASLDTLLSSTVKRAASLTGTSSSGVYLMEPHGKSLKLAFGHNLHKEYIDVELMLGEGLSGQVAQSGKPINLEDYQTWPGQAEIYKDASFHQVLGVPLIVNDKVIGVLTILDYKRTGLFSEEQVRLVTLFANQAALAIDHARLYQSAQLEIAERKKVEETLRQRAHELDTLYASAMMISSNLSMDVVIKTVVEQMTKAFNTDGCALSFWDQQQDTLVTMADFGSASLEELETRGTTYSLKDYPSARHALETGEIKIHSRHDPQLVQTEMDLMDAQGLSVVLFLPLIVRDQVIGLMELYETENKDRIFTENEIRLANSLSVQTAVFVENARLYQNIQLELQERKQVEAALRGSEQRYHALFEDMPVAIWEEDFSEVKKHLDLMKEQGVTDFRSYFESNPGAVREYNAMIKVLDVNQATLKLYHANSKEELLETVDEAPGERMMAQLCDILMAISEGKKSHIWEGADETIMGEPIEVSLSWSVAPDHEVDFSRVIVTTLDITKRKQAEDALRESQSLYHSLVEVSPLSICRKDLAGRFTFANRRFLELSETTLTDLVGLTDFDLHPSELAEKYRRDDQAVIDGGQVQELIEERMIIGGKHTSVQTIKAPIYGSDGMVNGVQISFWDVTDSKQAEEALRRSEERYRALFEDMPIAIWEEDFSGAKKYLDSLKEQGVKDLRAYFTYNPEAFLECGTLIKVLDVNQATLDMYHANSKEDLYKNMDDGLNQNEVEHILDALVAISEGQTSHRWEGADDTVTGEPIEISLSWAVVPGYEDDFSKVIATTMDITARRQTEQALKKSEQRYHTLFEEMPVAIWEEDFSDVKKYLDSLKDKGVTDLRAYFESDPDAVLECYTMIKVLDVNQAALKMYQAESKAALLESLDRGPGKGELEHLIDDLIAIAKGRVSNHWEGADETFEGESIETSLNWTVAPGYEADFSKVIVTTMDITDRKQAQQALEQSEKRFRSLIANAGDLIVVVNSLGVIQFASPSSERILGYSPEEAVGSNLSEWVHPQDLSEVLEKLAHRSHELGVSPESIQARGRHKDGSWRILDTIGTNLIDEPAIRGIVLNIRDITERKAAEDEIKSLARFPDENPTPVLRLSEEGIILYANKASQMLLEEWESVINQTAPAFWVQKIAEVFETQTQQVLDVELNTRVLSFVIAPIIGEGYVNLYARDITERRSTEEALRASEAQFRAIFEGAAIGIALVDISGHPVRVNSALQEMLGYDAEELRSMVFTDFTHPNDITIDWDLWGELTDGRRESYQIEKRLIHKDDHIIWVKLTSSIVPGADGKILFGVGMVEDITERKQAEEESKYQLAELEALYENGLAISRLLEPKRIAQRMVEVIDQKLDWHHAAVRFYDATTDHVELLALNTPGFNEDQIAEQIERINQAINTPDKGLSGWVIRHGEVIRAGKLKDDPRYFESYAGINSGLYIPIRTGDEVIGSITVESEEENAFSERDANTLTTLANQAAIAFVNARLYLWLQKELDERERAEEEIRKLNIELEQRVAERTAQIEVTKRRLELATHAGQIGVWEYIPRENKVIWDERMHMIHHIPEGEFAGTSEAWGNIIHPDDIGELHINRQLALTKNLLMNNEHRINWPDGSIHHIMASAVMAHSVDGTPERLIGINMDITERKMIEQSLRESENYARLLFDAVPDPVSVTDADGLIVDVNKAFEKQFSTSRDESRGKRISELGIYPQAEVGKREEYIADVLQGRTIKPVELEFYVPGDRIHTLELHSYLLKVNGRQLVLNTSHDITSHKKAEEVQRLAKAEMERALRIKNEFLANMSHELRTPLNSILGISESLEEQIAGTLNEKQLKYIGIVRESGRHLLELINDILDLSKIEAGRMELDIHKISVETLCQSSLRMIRELSQKKSLRVSFHNRGEIKIIRGDQRRLKQSLVNLLSNAVKFTPEGKEIGLEVSGNMETNEIEFTVWDQGVGIVEEDIKLLFKPFVQLDAGLAREYQGTGLGLALVSQMVHLHGGRVSVESKVWQGSRFTITLPWSPNEQTPRAQITAELLIPSPRSSAKRNGRILLVEDTDVVVQLISEYLRHKGYEIILANNGVEGIGLAAQEHPDLILMDVMMPIMDGLEATRRIRANESLQNIPIIALTALAMSGDSERCLAAGMNDYLSKPIRMQDLANMIEKYLKPAGEESNEQ